MRDWLKAAMAVLFSAYAVMAHADFQEDLFKRFPAAQGAKVSPAFPGFWSVTKGGEVFFVRDDLSILISGNVIDLKTHRSISAELVDANRPAMDVAQLDMHDAFKLTGGSRKLFVFEDPDCPYCRRLEGSLEELHDVSIYIFPFPLAQLHPNAPGVAEAIWCQSNPAQAWRDYQALARTKTADALPDAWRDYLHAHGQPDQPTCANPIERNLAFGQKWNINGTPTLIFQDGTIIPGAVPTSRIEAQLGKSAAVVLGAGK